MDKDKLTLNDSSYRLGVSSFRRNSALKLSVTDWLADLPGNVNLSDLVEVQFKNTRKGYFNNPDGLALEKGMVVAVEASPGHDIGEVTLTGELVQKQMIKNHIDTSRYEIRKVYRLATENDLKRAEEAHSKEQDTMIKARQLAKDLGVADEDRGCGVSGGRFEGDILLHCRRARRFPSVDQGFCGDIPCPY